MRVRLQLIFFIALATLVAALMHEAQAQEPCPQSRVCSTLGFSFEPPARQQWKSEFGRTSIQFNRILDQSGVSMYAGAIEGKTKEDYRGRNELVEFVRRTKSQWGTDGQYKNIKEEIAVERDQISCVRYRLYAEDTRARNLGSAAFLPTLSVGRFCLHPKNRSHAVDLYYSVRSTPGYATAELEREGEAFIASLQFLAK